jgi:hypothetical protein
MPRRLAFALCLLLAALVDIPSFGAAVGNDYTLEQNWLCRPGRTDACSTPTTSTVIAADGSRVVVTHAVAADAPIDCFYVYPTVSPEQSLNSDMASTGVEEQAAVSQFAPFGQQCRTFAPRYRQVTVAGLHSALGGGPRPDTALAYGDIVDAFHSYLAHDNQGRGFVLIGHSQGSGILSRLIAAEIDGKPLQSRFVSAIIPGTLVEVAAAADAGGTFAHIPLCARAGDTGCVVAYSTYLLSGMPVESPRFGVEKTAGRVAACVDPAKLAGSGTLDAEFPSVLSPTNDVATTFIDLPGVVSGRCVTRDAQTYIAITTTDDARGTRVAERLAALQTRRPGWGLHVLDMNLALGDLVSIVGTQAHSWAAK